MENLLQNKKIIKGVITVMVTPFKENYEVDVDGIKKLTRFLIENGIKKGTGVIIPTASIGECPMLTDEERKEIFRTVKKEAGDDAIIIGGCMHTDTQTVIKLAHYAEEEGLDGVMVSPPYYWKPTEEIIMTHFKAISKNTKLGIIVYNNWFATQLDMSVDTITRLVNEIPNIIALKDSTTEIEKFPSLAKNVGDKISVINGNLISNEPDAAFKGTRGFVTGEACLIPKTLIKLYESEVRGDYKKAKEILRDAYPILNFINNGAGADSIIRIKAAMNLVGLNGGIPRLPLLPISYKLKNELRKIIGNLKISENWSKNR